MKYHIAVNGPYQVTLHIKPSDYSYIGLVYSLVHLRYFLWNLLEQ